MKSVGELSQVCSQIVLKCWNLARIGRPDVLWSVNKLARSIAKWTKACDKRLNRLISYIHHTCEYRQYCHVGNTAKLCRLGLFQDSDSKSTSGGLLCIFGSHTFVPISWITAVSYSSTDPEIISLDTGLRLDGLLALELWDLIVSVFGSISQISDRSGQPDNDVNKHHKSQKRINVMENIDSVPSNVQSSRQEALLNVFEDNEALIKMIIKGRSPSMRHVSRTHRVALDWLYDRINLDPKIQIKYIDTKNQLADILTKGSFTRDEWNHLLCLFNINHFSSTIWSDTMAKRSQQDSGAERVTAKSKPMMNLIARTPSLVSSSTSVSPEKKLYGSQDPWKSVAGEDRSGRPDKDTDKVEASDHYFHEQYMECFSSTNYFKLDDDRAWSSQEWKAEIKTYDRSGRHDKTSWRMVRKVRPDHGENLLDGTAQSARYGETLRDRSGRPDIDSQEKGMASSIRHWKRWNRIGIVCRIKIIRESGEWSSAEKTEKNFQRCRRWRRTFYYLVNVYGCNNGISSIHGKGFPKQSYKASWRIEVGWWTTYEHPKDCQSRQTMAWSLDALIQETRGKHNLQNGPNKFQTASSTPQQRHQTRATFTDARKELSDSENGGACGQVKR